MRHTMSQQNFQSFASVNTYENILNRYKTKKDLLAKTHMAEKYSSSNKENVSTSPSSKGDGYLNFLEKQVERANRAFQETAQQKEQIQTISERIEILELAQQDQARKWGLFVGDISIGRGIM